MSTTVAVVLPRLFGSRFPWRWVYTTLRVRSSGSIFCRNYQRTKRCRSWELVEVIVALLTHLFSVCSISLVASVMYICQTIQSCTHYTRERAAGNMQGTVFTLARLKIVSTIKNSYHIQCQCVNQLSSSVWIKLQHPFPDSYYQAGSM